LLLAVVTHLTATGRSSKLLLLLLCEIERQPEIGALLKSSKGIRSFLQDMQMAHQVKKARAKPGFFLGQNKSAKGADGVASQSY